MSTQSNTPRAWELTELMVRVFDAVVDRQREPPSLDGAAMAAMMRKLLAESRDALRAEILAELRAVQPANQLPDPQLILDRRAKPLVLVPILTVARL